MTAKATPIRHHTYFFAGGVAGFTNRPAGFAAATGTFFSSFLGAGADVFGS